MKQAVVLIHGIGEQKPMETLRRFVSAVLPPAEDGQEAYFSKPDRMSELFELRRLKSRGRTKTDFYEYYWAYNVDGTKLSHLARWFVGLLFRRWRNIPSGLKSVWLFSWSIVIALAALTSLGYAAYIGEWIAAQPYYGPVWIITVLTLTALQGFLVYYVGDAARYLSPSPRNIALRQKIRTEGLQLLRHLHRSKEYDRIVVVGHSLGSVIGYDLITRLWIEYNSVYDFKSRANTLAACLSEHKPPQPIIGHRLFEAGQALSPDGNGEALQSFRCAQFEGWKEQRTWGNPWRVSDFITIGSPLAHAVLLLASDRQDFNARKAQRELPTCPPVRDRKGYGYVDEVPRDLGNGRRFSPHILHHGAAFAVTRWTNLYCPAYLGLFGDIIGGPLRDVFGAGITDVPTKVHGWRRWTLLAHTAYWSGETPAAKTTGPGNEPRYALDALKDALGLEQLRQFRIEDRLPPSGKQDKREQPDLAAQGPPVSEGSTPASRGAVS